MKTDIQFLMIINVMPQLTNTEEKSLKTSASPSVFLLFVKFLYHCTSIQIQIQCLATKC